MAIGPIVRQCFGRHEPLVSEIYRRGFINLDRFTGLMLEWVPQAQRVLEVDCGEGAMTERLVKTYPTARVTAIDITPRLGRLYRGPMENVVFSQETIENVASRAPASFDLVVVVDVLHHVPRDSRRSLMDAVRGAMAPGARLVFKDWIISRSPVHWLCEASDRYLTGDKVSYFTMNQIEALIAETFGGPEAIRQIRTVPPWKNNVAVLVTDI